MTKKPPKAHRFSLLLIALFLSTAANLTNITAANAQGYALNLGLNLLSRATGVRLMPAGMSGYDANYNAAVGSYNRGVKLLNAERYSEARYVRASLSADARPLRLPRRVQIGSG
ncbi:MAG: hypothetical protein KGS72_01390 [Cyanobacteria bacterium REEB67]|nr:hypothetical protein [Cyanobacteria bacterium REEB67]